MVDYALEQYPFGCAQVGDAIHNDSLLMDTLPELSQKVFRDDFVGECREFSESKKALFVRNGEGDPGRVLVESFSIGDSLNVTQAEPCYSPLNILYSPHGAASLPT
jgi:hypothetical protein